MHPGRGGSLAIEPELPRASRNRFLCNLTRESRTGLRRVAPAAFTGSWIGACRGRESGWSWCVRTWV